MNPKALTDFIAGISKKITDFISGLSSLGKKLFIAATVLIVFAIFDRLMIAPTMSRLATINEDIAKEENAIKEDARFLSYKDRILKEAKLVDSYIISNVPSDDEIITSIFKRIEVLATKANVSLAKVSPPIGEQQDDHLKYTTDVECSGKLSEIVIFMHLINSSEDLLKIVKFNLGSKKADSDEIKAVLTINKIIVSKKNLPKPAKSSSDKPQADASKTKAS